MSDLNRFTLRVIVRVMGVLAATMIALGLPSRMEQPAMLVVYLTAVVGLLTLAKDTADYWRTRVRS